MQVEGAVAANGTNVQQALLMELPMIYGSSLMERVTTTLFQQ